MLFRQSKKSGKPAKMMKLESIKELSFDLEKDIQTLTEKTLPR